MCRAWPTRAPRMVILPVCRHECEEVVCAKRCYDSGDVGVGARGIAVRIVGAVAAVRPDMRQLIAEVLNDDDAYHSP
jgi:hypothetical protein